MANPTMTIRVGQSRAIVASILVGKIPKDSSPTWASSNAAIAALFISDDPDRRVVYGNAAGSANITCTVGAVVATMAVTVIAAGTVEEISLQPGF